MSEANLDRGEHELTLAGTPYKLRPSYAAIAAMEKRTGKSLVALARAANIGDLTLADVGGIACELIRAGADDDLGRQVSPEKIGELCYEEGMPHVVATLTICLVDAATGGRTASGEAKAEASAPKRGRASAR